MYTFLDELAKIENGAQNQHEASYNIGMLLKSLYVDKKIYNESPASKKNSKSSLSKSKTNNLSYAEYKEKYGSQK